MAEHINREVFLKGIEERYCLPCKEAGEYHNGFMCAGCWVGDLRSEVIGAPAADVAPVVHCKDCAHRTEMGNCGHPRYHGILPSAYPYDFCSYGARMDDGACSQVCKYNTPDRGRVAGELGARCDLTNVAGERGNGEAG